MPLISIVMPVYNAEKYIQEAIDSVVNQTFNDWELIIVNDGSTDSSLNIIKNYAARYSQIQYSSIANSGSAKVPRDTAILESRGEWVVALDADDYLSADSLEMLYNRQKETKSQIVLQRLKVIENDRARFIPNFNWDMDKVLSAKEALKLTIGGWKIAASGMLINRKLLTDLYSVGDVVYMSSDELDTRKRFLSANSIALSEGVYTYRRNEESITKKISLKKFDLLIVDDMLSELITKNFDKSDPIFDVMELTKFKAILNAKLLFLKNSNSFSSDERQKVKNLIRFYYNKLDLSRVNYPWYKRSLHMSGYALFSLTTYIQSKI